MGRKVRISEQNLHKIIKESVEQYLTELNWKTYMNAARKRQEQGKNARSQELEDYAQQQFQQQHQGAFDDVNYDGVAHPQEISGKTRNYRANVRRDGATTNMDYSHSGANTYDGNYKTFNTNQRRHAVISMVKDKRKDGVVNIVYRTMRHQTGDK